uniref:Uncharacterized protein n=1 Tax=Onchocerca volvulus TaxID=6282 RepID=A0A8R1TRW4_ONCVO
MDDGRFAKQQTKLKNIKQLKAAVWEVTNRPFVVADAPSPHVLLSLSKTTLNFKSSHFSSFLYISDHVTSYYHIPCPLTSESNVRHSRSGYKQQPLGVNLYFKHYLLLVLLLLLLIVYSLSSFGTIYNCCNICISYYK